MKTNILPIFIFYQDTVKSGYSRLHYFLLGSVVVLGTILRFWGLGNVGLHGDEELMGMPTLQILESGLPLLPSGMLYPRAVTQLYLMASSVWIFGHSEWALRFPSAVAGSAGIIVAFFLGKRFLLPRWNIVFVLIIALLPAMITASQTARMYIFFSTFVMLYAVMIFRWEKKRSWVSLIGAFVVFLIALEFHLLTIFASLLFFLPLFIKPSKKTFIQSSLAFILAGVAFLALRTWQGLQYGETLSQTIAVAEDKLSALEFLITHHSWMIGLGSLLFLSALAWILYYQKSSSGTFYTAILLFIVASIAFLTLHYHIGLILFGCGVILHIRSGGQKILLAPIIGFLVLLLILQLYLLYESNLFPGRKVLGALVGTPSVWPYLRLADYFPVGFALYGIPFLYAAANLAKRSRIPDHYLFFVIAVWTPLLMIGFLKWHVPPRYTFGVVPFLILVCVAGTYYVGRDSKLMSDINVLRHHLLLMPLLLVAFVNPFALKTSVNVNYSTFPDHKGAASFMKTVRLNPEDIIVAEDVLQQTYYLGKVHYWLRAFNDAQYYVRNKNGVLRDIRTSTPLIGTGKELEELLKNEDRGSVYIIGSGETFHKRPYFLANGILKVIGLYKPQIVYTGRDHKTVVWYFPRPKRI